MKAVMRDCEKCGKRFRSEHYQDRICDCCGYQSQVEYMRTIDPDDQDWEFAHCEECGSSFDSCGVCRNQNCGNSPDLGKDWY